MVLLIGLLLCLLVLCCPCFSEVALQASTHQKRVIALLFKEGDIGLGETEDSQVSLATTLCYAVLRVAQWTCSCLTSTRTLMSLLFAFLCPFLFTSGSNKEPPKGGTKYVMVEFNAWVYSGVRRHICLELLGHIVSPLSSPAFHDSQLHVQRVCAAAV